MDNRTKYIPSIVMLAAAFVACIMSIYYEYTTKELLLIVLGTIVVFFVIGLFVKLIADKYLIVSVEAEMEMEEGSEEEGISNNETGSMEKDSNVNMDMAPKKKK